jgi:hypothetical protein
MTRDAEPCVDNSLPQEFIDQIQKWVEETVDSASSPVYPSVHILRTTSTIDDAGRKYFSKLRGDQLAQYARAVFQLCRFCRQRNKDLYAKLYNGGIRQRNPAAEEAYARQFVLECFADKLLARKLPLSSELIDDALRVVTDENMDYVRSERVIKLAVQFGEANELSPLSRQLLAEQRDYWETKWSSRAFTHSINKVLKIDPALPIVPGDAWADVALAELNALGDDPQKNWCELLAHAASIGSAKPGKKWREGAVKLIDDIGRPEVCKRTTAWLRLIGEPGTVSRKIMLWRDATDNTVLDDTNRAIAVGLVWMLVETGGDAAVLSQVVRATLKRIGQGQLRCEPLGNAAVRALGSIPGESGIAQLAQLEVLIRLPKPRKLIRKTLAESAEREGISLVDLEETSVPDLGLDDGRISRRFGDFTAEIVPSGDHAQISWINRDGERKKVVPKQLKLEHPDAQADIKHLAAQLETLLPAQRSRIERLTKSTRSWAAASWRARYLDHPLVSLVARRLIWTINDRAVLWNDGAAHDVDGSEVDVPDDADVQLWHPIGRAVDEVLAWRNRLESLRVTQPFKQAHREIYVLTDAEIRTGTYSNRFGAHILKNTTMIALCQTRGWVTGMFGGQTGPRLDLPDFGVRAEFWVEAAGDNYTDFGAPLYMSTDQVRFYPLTLVDADRLNHAAGLIDPLPLERVPPRALTETMRDVDLFIGLSSVGNDPNWSDGGPDGRFRTYWQNYSFGDLNESAKTRRDALARIVPRLDIADRCQLDDKFLRVKGHSRVYKIHLGSGNILMEPNDQYLCIVPDRHSDERGSKVFLPFDGDRTLSIILSKAMMLADDAKITDATILNQIRLR